MKKILLLSLTLLCSSIWAQTNQTTLNGKITDGGSGEELIGANIAIYLDGVVVAGASTDFEGNYSVVLKPRTYLVEVSYIGYQAVVVKDVVVEAGQANKLDVKLGEEVGGVNLDEIVVIEYKIPRIRRDETSCGGIKTAVDIARLPTTNITNLAATTSGISAADEGDVISVRGSRSSGTDVYVDGSRVNTSDIKLKTKKSSTSEPKVEKDPAAGQLTAGEWKDLDNWDFWDQLMKNEQFAGFQKFWGFYPKHRFEIKLSDKMGRPLANVKVDLLNAEQEVVWSSVSDNKGSACLWGNFYGGDDDQFQLRVSHPTGDKSIAAIPYTDGLNSLELEMPCASNKMIDVAFVVDVTGSMSDELRYLKSEIGDVINRAKTEEVDLEMRTAAVYYAGQHQTHVLKSSPLTEKSEETIHFMKTSPRAGGENYEAVDQGLGIAIRDLDWNTDAMARIVFLVLDASPYHGDEVKENLHKMIREAAEKGIKVIPVASSGIRKDTEFLLKFFAMGTNSTYTFLTNHSGIGGYHIAPEAGSYNVETLNDLLVRLIIENGEYHDCDATTSVIPEMLETKKEYQKLTSNNNIFKKKRKKTNKKESDNISLFPNPAVDHVNIKLEKDIELMIITTMDGQIVGKYPQVRAGQIRLQTSSWTAGTYFVSFYMDGKVETRKLMVNGEGEARR